MTLVIVFLNVNPERYPCVTFSFFLAVGNASKACQQLLTQFFYAVNNLFFQ
jgi:hypothetical protein